MTSFSAQVEEWTRKVPGALEAVFKQSAQDIVEEMQTPVGAGGHMRVDTGFLRASLLASTSRMPSINPEARPADGQTYSPDGQIELVIAGADIVDELFFGYTAAYAGVREYRDGFVRMAAMNWRETVFRNTARVKKAMGL